MALMPYRVYVNRRLGRVLVSGRPEDEELIREGWKIIREEGDWEVAFEFAREFADMHDYVLEWYLEEGSEHSRLAKPNT
jgi:hypothetical protein